MRDCKINKRKIHYALCTGTEDVGDYGETAPTYGEQVEVEIKVDYVGRAVSVEAFGKDGDCDVKLITTRKDLPFDENTIFWIDAATSDPHDYVFAKEPKKCINSRVYYLKKVGVSYAAQD